MMEIGSAPEITQSGRSIETRYKIRDNQVQVSGQEFLPRGKELKDPKEIVVFLVGAPMRANADVTWGQPQKLADQFGVKSVTLDARPLGKADSDAIGLEVEGLSKYLAEEGYNKATIFGHSIGAKKAADLVVNLEENNPDIKINGLVLANPMGFYPQDKIDLVKRWFKEAGGQAKNQNPNSPHESISKTLWQLARSVLTDVKQAGLGYKKLAGDQFKALTENNPSLAKVKSPTVILLGSSDLLSEADKVLPEAEIIQRLPQGDLQSELMRKVLREGRKWDQLTKEEQEAFGDKNTYVTVQADEVLARAKARDQYVKEHVLPNAENVKVIVADKYASHIGFTVERVDQTSHMVSKIFERLRR